MRTRFYKILSLAAILAIAGYLETFYPGSGFIFAAAGLYADKNIGYGKVPYRHPLNHPVHRNVEEGPIYFGRAVKDGTNPQSQVKPFNSSDGVFRGVAANYIGTKTEGQYEALEGSDIRESGFANVFVSEAVSPASPVRIRHSAVAAVATASNQTVDLGIVAGGDPTGLANDITEYSETIKIGNDFQAVIVQGQDCQTFATLVAAINAGLAGAQIAIVGNDLKITASETGEGHEIEIQIGGNLFSELNGFVAILDPVNGVDAVSAPELVGSFCTTADAGKTVLAEGVEYRGITTGPGMVALFMQAGKKKTTADV